MLAWSAKIFGIKQPIVIQVIVQWVTICVDHACGDIRVCKGDIGKVIFRDIIVGKHTAGI
jgi:hypothetical protein